MDETSLLDGLIKADNTAFRMLIDTYGQMVYICAFKFLRNEELAKDVTQEVFIEVFRSAASFRKSSKLSTWLYRIAITKSLNSIKYHKRKKRFAAVYRLFGKEEIELQLPAPSVAQPEQINEQQERKAILHTALNSLNESQRVAFTLSKIEGMSYAEIAGIMGTGVGAVESLIHRAKTNLKKKLETYYKDTKK